MLTKITDDIYIDFSEVYLVDKQGRDIKVYVKCITADDEPHIISSTTKAGKEFMRLLDEHLK